MKKTRRQIILMGLGGAIATPALLKPDLLHACEFVSFSTYDPNAGGGPAGSAGPPDLYGHTSSPEGIDGLDPVFRANVAAMIAAANREYGGNMVIYSGYRSIEHQRRLYEAALVRHGSPAAARRWVAPPGGSMHNYGLAVDLRHNGVRVEYGQGISNWMTANLARFNLHRRLSNEGWHVEPIGGLEMKAQIIAGARASGQLADPQNDSAGVPNYAAYDPSAMSCDEVLRNLPMAGLMPWGDGGEEMPD